MSAPLAHLRAPDIVCVAASTGGPQAVGAFLDALDGPPPCPVLIVQHMPGEFTGRFAERLDRRGTLSVHEARTGAPLRAGEILVAPGASHLRIRHRRVRLSDDPPVGGLRPRADLTLIDLAAEYGSGATAVVLSGMGSDGYDGALAVAEAGGQVLVQDAASCSVDGMPARIREEGLATLVAPPGELAEALGRAWHDEATPGGRRGEPGHHDAPGPSGVPQRRAPAAAASAAVDQVFSLLRRQEGIDLRPFKPGQIRRNLDTFLGQHGVDLADLPSSLDRDPALRRDLVDHLTINVTAFFRDAERWADIERLVIPGLGPAPRVWNPGCADGSETCSLAMLLRESGRRPVVWATDVNVARIEAARAGTYSETALADLPTGPGGTDRRERWFDPMGDEWSVGSELRASIRYERHDAIDGPLGDTDRFDLVICRNLIIYLTAEGRDRLLGRIAEALADGGAVLLGSAERVLRPESFGLVRIAPGLYRRDATGDPS